ncbi:fasciclin domain-containing protein [Corynebacterium pelargi]|uniref:Immunogenic protein MPT70 n=1 Tax=Corynebacterium pelargi TaxID=1471400 RepID=A0A410WAC3_9CORY|nr:fasciclin domain-containing protein [Corynebacterium pelargi]QAU52889.1 Immunogenic protein MPT70 precursor [Corynebacterium pelargi]GGG76264.1 immunogenic protein MPT70 [Corynebacterium pelargi]
MHLHRRTAKTAAAIVAASTLLLSACSNSDEDSTASSEATTSAVMSSTSAAATSTEAVAGDSPKGPLCQAYADAHPDGPASLEVISAQNVVDALPNIPELSTLTSALAGELNPDVNLIATIKDGQWTIFAPINAAFEKLDAETIEQLKNDPELLSKILTYHVVDGKADLSAVVGEHTTVEGTTLEVTDGDPMKVNDATIGCGNVPTENAQVYLIDSVLIPAE